MTTSNELAEACRKDEIDKKMKTMIREILFYLIFLILLLIVVNGQQDTSSYRQNSNLIGILTRNSLANKVCAKNGVLVLFA